MLGTISMHVRATLLCALFITGFGASAFALDRINPTGPDHLAIRGADPTSYFTDKRPSSGRKDHTVRWKGATWRFGSAADAALFRANPSAYAPQFGAYCTGGLAQRHVVEGKPQYWRIHGRKLYLFHTRAGANRFDKAPAATIRKAKAYWNSLGVKN